MRGHCNAWRSANIVTTIGAQKFSTPKARPFEISATANLVKQVPLIARDFPEFAEAKFGTINLRLDKALLVANYDHRTVQIGWQGDGSAEVFDLVRAQLEVNAKIFDGWLYVAHGSGHRRDLRIHEFIARSKIEIQDGDRCSLHMVRDCNSIPYQGIVVLV